MRRSQVLAGLLSLALAASIAVGCQKKAEAPPPVATTPAPAPFKVTGVELGKSLTAERKVASPAKVFGTRDTIYAVVASEGAAKNTVVKALWTYRDTSLVTVDSLVVAPTGPAWTEFHISKATRWPVGMYAVEVSVDGAPVRREVFEIK